METLKCCCSISREIHIWIEVSLCQIHFLYLCTGTGLFSVRYFFEKCAMFLASPVKRGRFLRKLRMCRYWVRTWRQKNTLRFFRWDKLLYVTLCYWATGPCSCNADLCYIKTLRIQALAFIHMQTHGITSHNRAKTRAKRVHNQCLWQQLCRRINNSNSRCAFSFD
jgi:hypothetical protein